jgi:hypothetical protein
MVSINFVSEIYKIIQKINVNHEFEYIVKGVYQWTELLFIVNWVSTMKCIWFW